jgi:arylsulfatase A
VVIQNEQDLPVSDENYGPDVFINFITDFIQRKKDRPFFIYYPMVLTHAPFGPTPHSPDWEDPKFLGEQDTTYFKDMVAYVDFNVGRIVTALRENGLEENTILIFTGDNGNPRTIWTATDQGLIQGEKGRTTDGGTRVPLIISWPGTITPGSTYDGLIEFSDFFPTFAEIAEQEVSSDGHSFYPLLIDSTYVPRETAFLHFIPKTGEGPNDYRYQFVRNGEYKLYRNGRFFHLPSDRKEQSPLPIDSLSENELDIYRMLETELQKHPG